MSGIEHAKEVDVLPDSLDLHSVCDCHAASLTPRITWERFNLALFVKIESTLKFLEMVL